MGIYWGVLPFFTRWFVLRCTCFICCLTAACKLQALTLDRMENYFRSPLAAAKKSATTLKWGRGQNKRANTTWHFEFCFRLRLPTPRTGYQYSSEMRFPRPGICSNMFRKSGVSLDLARARLRPGIRTTGAWVCGLVYFYSIVYQDGLGNNVYEHYTADDDLDDDDDAEEIRGNGGLVDNA